MSQVEAYFRDVKSESLLVLRHMCQSITVLWHMYKSSIVLCHMWEPPHVQANFHTMLWTVFMLTQDLHQLYCVHWLRGISFFKSGNAQPNSKHKWHCCITMFYLLSQGMFTLVWWCVQGYCPSLSISAIWEMDVYLKTHSIVLVDARNRNKQRNFRA